MRLTKITQWFSFIFYKFLDTVGWAKILIQGISGIYGTFSAIDLSRVLSGEHPAEVFFHWVLLSHPLRIFIIAQVILLFIAITEKFAIGSYTKLKLEIKEKDDKLDILNNNIKELFEGLLMSFANAELAFGTQEQNQERISLYLAKRDTDNNINYLYPIGRYSSNPNFRNVRRSRYSIDKGCIGEAYKNDYCYNGNVSDLYSYSPEEYNSMRMKSKTIVAISVKDKENQIIGVLVAESKEENWQITTIKRKLEKQVKYYAEICIKLKDYINSKVDIKSNITGDMPW